MSEMTSAKSATEFAGPLVAVEAGHLMFARGAAHLKIQVDDTMDDLYRARFEGKAPDVWADAGVVTVRYRSAFRPPHGEITLSGRIPWTITARFGMSDIMADLEDADLKGFEISGGASQIEARLPEPKDAVPIRIGGGSSRIDLIRPAGVPVRVRVGAGASKLAIDDLDLGAIGGMSDWRSPDYDKARARYDIEIGAGASKVTVRSR